MADSIAPWIQGADPARNFAPMFSEAANAASRKAQLGQEMMRMQIQQAQHAAEMQAHQEQMAQEMELKKQVMQQNQMMDQQRMAIQQQYHQQQGAIAQQKADEAAKKNAMAAQQYASKAAAQMEYQKRVSANPQDATKAMMELGPRMSGGNLGGMGSILKQGAPPPQTQFGQSSSGRGYAQVGNQFHWEPNAARPPVQKPTPEQVQETEYRKTQATILKDSIVAMEKDAALATSDKVKSQLEDRISSKQKELKGLFNPKGEGEKQAGGLKAVLVNGKLVLQKPDTDNLPDLIDQMKQPAGAPEDLKWQGDLPQEAPAPQPQQQQMPAAAGLPFGM